MIFILLRNYLISKITHQWSLLHKEISKLLFQYGLHWWFYEHQNHNQSHSNQWRSAYQLIHKLFYCEVWEMVHVCMCVCVCVCVWRNVLSTFVRKKKSDKDTFRDPMFGLTDHYFNMRRMTKEFHTEIRYVTIRNSETSSCSTNFTLISLIFWEQIFKCMDHTYMY